jgi:hypothetical protein
MGTTLLGVRYPGSLAAAYETASMYVVPAEKSKKLAGAPTSTYLANEEVAQAGNRANSRRRARCRRARSGPRRERSIEKEGKPSAEQGLKEDG